MNSMTMGASVLFAVALGLGQSPVTLVDEGVTLKQGIGWVYTDHWYLDFDIDLEFRVREPGRHGGIVVRSRFRDPNDRMAYRISLSDKADGVDALGKIVPRNSSARQLGLQELQFDTRQLGSVMKSAGDWQKVRIRSDGSEIRVFVNDALVTIALAVPLAGHIGLEGEGRDIEVRQMRVQRRDTYLQPLPESGGNLAYVTRVDFINKTAVLARLLKEVKPDYSPEGMRRRVEGIVSLEAIIYADGTVGPVRVVKPLHLDLDQEAVSAVKQWRFTPAQKDGQAIAARIEVEMSFSLKK